MSGTKTASMAQCSTNQRFDSDCAVLVREKFP